MNTKVINNYAKVGPNLLFIPLVLLSLIFFFLFKKNALSVEGYINIQKNWFFYINSELSQFPEITYNLTQFGDSLIFLTFLSILIIYTPKMWEALVYSCLCSLVFSSTLKNLFCIPRPAAVLNHNNFVIIGKTIVYLLAILLQYLQFLLFYYSLSCQRKTKPNSFGLLLLY